ncbi:MAG: CinA family protein [Candidatus Puniceispirillaceae bacterium]
MTDQELQSLSGLARQVIDRAMAAGVMLTTAESCTGGMVAAALTDIAGASAVLDRGVVTYSNAAKTELLGVPEAILETHGAVSRQTAAAMADGALHAAPDAGLAIAVTGIAGPGGGTAEKPVGLVWFGLANRHNDTVTAKHIFSGDREAVRLRATATALDMLRDGIG